MIGARSGPSQPGRVKDEAQAGASRLEVEAAVACPEIEPAWLRTRFVDACRHLGIGPAAFCVRLVDSDEMAAMHRQFCGQEGPTDVLTFDREGEELAADVLICVDVARSEAGLRGHAVHEEVLLYLLHALLHRLGYDDQDEAGYREMHRIEDEVLASIGVGRRFEPSDDPLE